MHSTKSSMVLKLAHWQSMSMTDSFHWLMFKTFSKELSLKFNSNFTTSALQRRKKILTMPLSSKCMLQPGREWPPNAFKRCNLFDGPVWLNPTLVSAKEADKLGSPFQKSCSLSSQGLAASGSSPGLSGNKNVTLCAKDCNVPNSDLFSAYVASGSSTGPSGTGSVTVRAGDHVVSGSDNSLTDADSASGSSHNSGENLVHASDEHNEIETGLPTCLLLVDDWLS